LECWAAEVAFELQIVRPVGEDEVAAQAGNAFIAHAIAFDDAVDDL